jgi:3-hydroxyisobutyrate dehydrogenase-like beta-hydroxyacid dehydrogenase
MKLGFIGLGRMGSRMVRKLLLENTTWWSGTGRPVH